MWLGRLDAHVTRPSGPSEPEQVSRQSGVLLQSLPAGARPVKMTSPDLALLSSGFKASLMFRSGG